eukprot:TRINITY_DN4207_c0_g1_i13.p1 TRINITY_DN4207_c0_g1~~TRINITY_DN4207_c0_g1_i13.p1  ORF type:complete len:151 (-),score=9.40 TRINITY_DN4207_c0_g1_i13:433-885(-)
MEKQLAASTMKDPVNIPRRVKDAYYRYQMPKLTVESQGKNQATVTIITNLDAVASALATRTEYIMKYLSVTLNVRTQDNRIRGRYTAEQLARLNNSPTSLTSVVTLISSSIFSFFALPVSMLESPSSFTMGVWLDLVLVAVPLLSFLHTK